MRSMMVDSVTGERLYPDSNEPMEFWRGNERAILWLDLDGSDPERESRLLRTEFGLHNLAVDDAMRDRHPPKVEFFDDVMFLLLRGLDAASNTVNFATIQLAIFAGPRFLVTRHNNESPSTNWLWQRVEQDPALMRAGAQFLALELMNRVVRRYIPLLLDLEPRLEEVEQDIFKSPRDTDQIIEELTGYKSDLKRMRRLMTYHQQVADEIADLASEHVRLELRHEIKDIREQLTRSVTLSDLYIDLAGDLVNAYLAIASHRLNQIFRVLTIITVIFVPLSFLAGVYGMNFEEMPELGYPGAYHTLLLIMACIVLLQVWLFRRKKWL